jgi:hypothetical protein
MWKALHDSEKLHEWEGMEVRIGVDERYSDSLEVIEFIGADDKVIWKQHWVNE